MTHRKKHTRQQLHVIVVIKKRYIKTALLIFFSGEIVYEVCGFSVRPRSGFSNMILDWVVVVLKSFQIELVSPIPMYKADTSSRVYKSVFNT